MIIKINVLTKKRVELKTNLYDETKTINFEIRKFTI